MKFYALALTLVTMATPSLAQENLEWTTSTSGGSTIEIPIFLTEGWMRALMVDGEDYGTAFEPNHHNAQLRQYRTGANTRPFVYLSDAFGPLSDEITYSFDQSKIGAISGYSHGRKEVFYAMCRRTPLLVCFDMHYPAEEQATFGPIVERVAKSFRNQ